ncbi:hypothetical protein tloyanaT_14620 [Thalassotalea loyana]|uniref:DksA C4-type domain-containing protein n=1 Tax=Thalassotalea loyana TaxID=280483 RepID=A0ABQ6HEN8_9GAMM|nr:hypothetical protein [Thalassotalea loyana]GLX85210.1 hypothetical protein tloyanaT_14620 [Thalassotalea loyana]
MIDKASLKAFEKASQDSFFKQRNIIKQVLAGKKVLCAVCNMPVVFSPPKKEKPGRVACTKKCTDIELDMS